MKIIIQLEGGLVQGVFIKGKGPVTAAVTVDFDKDINPKDPNVVTFKNNGRELSAAISESPLEKLPKNCDVLKALSEAGL